MTRPADTPVGGRVVDMHDFLLAELRAGEVADHLVELGRSHRGPYARARAVLPKLPLVCNHLCITLRRQTRQESVRNLDMIAAMKFPTAMPPADAIFHRRPTIDIVVHARFMETAGPNTTARLHADQHLGPVRNIERARDFEANRRGLHNPDALLSEPLANLARRIQRLGRMRLRLWLGLQCLTGGLRQGGRRRQRSERVAEPR